MISVMESIRHYGKTVVYNVGQYLRWLFLGAVTGLLVGLVAAAFSHCLTLATAFRTSHRFLFLLLPAGGLIIVFLYKALHYENNHGTDSIIESIHTKVAIPLKMAFLIFVSTVITIFFGGSVGRESAALQMGASLGTSVGNLFHLSEKDKKTILMSGMAAAFSALFGTPMTASFFAMEVSSVGIMYYAALVPCICAALIARQTALFLGVETDVFRAPNSLELHQIAACPQHRGLLQRAVGEKGDQNQSYPANPKGLPKRQRFCALRRSRLFCHSCRFLHRPGSRLLRKARFFPDRQAQKQNRGKTQL